MIFRRNSLPWWVVLVSGFCTVMLWACSVPVFRYALEKWPSDPYQAIVFHRGPLTESQAALARNLGGQGDAGKRHANLTVRTVDLAGDPDPKLRELWQKVNPPTLPWLVLKYPSAADSASFLWSGPLDQSSVDGIIESPARQETIDRLAQGESAVWILLESGDKKKDDAIAAELDTRLTYLMATLKLPKLEAQDIAEKLVSIPEEDLKLAFSVYRLSRKQAGEAAFIQMLLGSEPDLGDTTEPIVFPIFGRGRALYALVGKGINRETIDQAATFLIGKCSCQVKELNPGIDLLLAADWETLIKTPHPGERDLPVLTNLAGLQPETVTYHGGSTSTVVSVAQAATPAVAISSSVPIRLIVLASLVLASLGGLLLLRRK